MRRRVLISLSLLLLVLAGWLLWRNAEELGGGDALPREEGHASALDPVVRETEAEDASLAGSSDAQPAPAAAGTRGAALVRVLGRGDEPLPDFPVVVIDADGGVPAARFTNERGEARFTDVLLDGSVSVATVRLNRRGGLLPSGKRPLTSPELTLRSDLGMSCDISIVDAESGAVMPSVGWSVHPWEAFLDASGLARTPGPKRIPVRPGVDLQLQLRIAVPEGYVGWKSTEPEASIARYATALRYVHPLHREADVEIDVLEHDGSPARDPWVTGWTLGGKEGAPLFGGGDAEPLALNRIRLRGVPFVAGAMLRVAVGLKEAEDEGQRIAVAEGPLQRPTRLVARLPHPDEYKLTDEPFQPPPPGVIGVGGGPEEPPPPPAPGTVELRGFRRDGRPAESARISLHYLESGYRLAGVAVTLDDQGRVTKELPAGTWEIRFREPGLVESTTTFEVQAGEITQMRLEEREGCTVRLRVVDPTGRPCPSAKFRINDYTWRDLEGGIQRLDPYVDENGSRTLRHVSPGPELQLTAWYGGGRSTVGFRASEGETVDVTVEVEPAK